MIARTLTAALAAATFLAGPALAQDPEPFTLQSALGDPDNLTVTASYRVRYEALDGQVRSGLDDTDDLITLRGLLFAEYDAGPFRLGAELQDSRAYAVDAGSAVSTGEVNAFELIQGYVGIDIDGDGDGEDGTTATADIGRFTMDLGSRRLVGRNNFRNTTNAFTGARFEATGARNAYYTSFYTLPHIRLPNDKEEILDNEVEFDDETFNLTFWGGFTQQPKFFGNDIALELYFYALDEDDSPSRPTRDRELYTPGFRIYRNPAADKIDFELEGIYQLGSISASSAADAAELDVSAWSAHADVGYTFSGGWNPRVIVEYDIATGDDGEGDFNRFDALYGVRRPDWGPTSIYGPLGRANIHSVGTRLEVKPSSRLDGFVGYRAAWLYDERDTFASTGVRDPAGLSGDFAGHQIEARARYFLIPGLLRLEAGGAVLFPGEFLDDAPNASGNGATTYGYIDLTAAF